MEKDNNWPEEGEFVVCTVRTVKGFGAFAVLDEYPGREGFIHITEIASGWIKHIKDYIREGQKIVCKVMRVQPKKGHIDLSLKHVNEHQKREKIMQWKANQKAFKLLDIIAEKLGWSTEKCEDEFVSILVDEFGSFYEALEQIAINPDVLDDRNIDGEWKEALIQVALENIQPPYVEIRGMLTLEFFGPEGVNDLKNTLKAVKTLKTPKGTNVSIEYLGAPRYMIRVSAPDYKTAEDTLAMCVGTVNKECKKYKCNYSYERLSQER